MNTLENIKDFNVEGEHSTYFTPKVFLEVGSATGSITGESYLEDAFDFYDRIVEWFEKLFSQGGKGFTLDIKLVYFNTSSSRALLDVLRYLQSQKEKGKDIKVNWHYPDPDDGDILLEAEDFEIESGLKLNLIEYKLS